MPLDQNLTAAFEIKELSEDGNISGYAAVFNNVDLGGDILDSKAVDASIQRHREKGTKIKMLWQHDPSQPIGVWDMDAMRTDSKGVFVKGQILPSVSKGREVIDLGRAGAIDGLSIGYRTLKFDRDEKGHRLLKEIDLWETSVVTFPMNPEARASFKSLDSLRDAEHILRDAGVPAAFAKLIVKYGFDEAKSILERDQRDAEAKEAFEKSGPDLLQKLNKLKETFHA